MTTPTEKIQQDLFHYFEGRGVIAGHLVSIVDFAEKINPGHTADDLARMQAAFAELVGAGVFEAKSSDEFILTAKGLDLLRGDRAQHHA